MLFILLSPDVNLKIRKVWIRNKIPLNHLQNGGSAGWKMVKYNAFGYYLWSSAKYTIKIIFHYAEH